MWHFAAPIMKVLSMRRRCGNCGREQVAAAEKKDRAILCGYCGAEIPPPKPPSP